MNNELLDLSKELDLSTDEARKKINDFLVEVKKLKEMEEELKTKMLEYMKDNNITEPIKLEDYTISIIERKELNEKFDTDRFKDENPELAKKYTYYTSSSESVSFRKNRGKKK